MQRNTPPSATASRDNYSFHSPCGSGLSEPVILVAARNAPDTSNPLSPEEQPIFLESGYWLETGPDGNWRVHR